jgi:MATE family multidrug resistance protein
MIEVLLGLGFTRTVTIYVCGTMPIYIFFSWALIFGMLGFPKLGIAGAGWGITIGDWISALILCAYMFSRTQFKQYLSFSLSGKFYYLREIIVLGFPMGMMYCIELGFFLAITIFMGRIDIQSLSANQLTMQYLGPLMGTIFSIAQGLTIRMGHEMGANRFETARRAVYAAVMIVFIYMSVVAVFYWIAPDVLIAADFKLNNPANQITIQLARDFIFIAALFQIIEAVRITLYGALRGFKETHYSLLVSVISFWCIALPIGYFLSTTLKLGGTGFWWGMVIGAMCSVVLLYKRLKLKVDYHIAMQHQ